MASSKAPFVAGDPVNLFSSDSTARSSTSATFTSRPSWRGSGLRNASVRNALTASACLRSASACLRSASACLRSASDCLRAAWVASWAALVSDSREFASPSALVARRPPTS